MDETELGRSPVLATTRGDSALISSLHEELCAIEDQLLRLDQLLREAAHRQRFGGDDGAVARAREEERAHLADLDRLLTRLRAIEGQLLLHRRFFH
ncbi:MAG TPA: hypothetical protein VHG30_02970 [Microvirga sp.]|nr:hypothetical protein [Microvirga sp.]